MPLSKGMCYTVKDAANRFSTPTARRFTKGANRSPSAEINSIMDEARPPVTALPGIGSRIGAMSLAEIGGFSNCDSANPFIYKLNPLHLPVGAGIQTHGITSSIIYSQSTITDALLAMPFCGGSRPTSLLYIFEGNSFVELYLHLSLKF